MKAIFEREWKSCYTTLTGWLFTAFLLLFVGIYTAVINFSGAYPFFEDVLDGISFIYMLLIPILTMRVLAEERRQKTDQLLYALPLSMTRIVIGKYLALLCVLGAPLILISLYPLILSLYGSYRMLPAYGTLLAFFLLGSALIAIGMFISSLTENQTVAAVICFAAMLLNYFIGALADLVPGSAAAGFVALSCAVILLTVLIWAVTRNFYLTWGTCLTCEAILFILLLANSAGLEGLFPLIISRMSLFDRFYIFADGIFDLTGILYFVSVCAAFLFFTVQSMEKRRWD